MENRKRIRGGTQVIHFHRIGSRRFKRVSELVFVEGRPKAVLGWIDLAGLRTPIFLALDAGKLRRARSIPHVWYYDETTSDPRFDDMLPLPQQPRP